MKKLITYKEIQDYWKNEELKENESFITDEKIDYINKILLENHGICSLEYEVKYQSTIKKFADYIRENGYQVIIRKETEYITTGKKIYRLTIVAKEKEKAIIDPYVRKAAILDSLKNRIKYSEDQNTYNAKISALFKTYEEEFLLVKEWLEDEN